MHPGIQKEYIRDLSDSEHFQFLCHPGINCYNECCRMLELALTPYDVMRLRKKLGLASHDFLEHYTVVELDEGHLFPQIYLGMVDDGRGSCPFVTPEGCTVYQDRPGACRTYPLGRGAFQTAEGKQHEMFVLLQEPHCHGFTENQQQTVRLWIESQDLTVYNRCNDVVMTILHHKKNKNGLKLNQAQVEKFLLALYKIDDFRTRVLNKKIKLHVSLTPEISETIQADDTEMLNFAIQWLRHELFGE
jgi:Fe-S-cluster containining protein